MGLKKLGNWQALVRVPRAKIHKVELIRQGVNDLLSVLRDANTDPPTFRQHAERLGYLLVAEAMSDMVTDQIEIETPLEMTTGTVLRRPVVAVAVLRAGLGLLPSVLTLVPDAAIGFAGVQRNEETAERVDVSLRSVERKLALIKRQWRRDLQ